MLLLECEIHACAHTASEDGALPGSSHGEGRHPFKVPVQIDFHTVASTWPRVGTGQLEAHTTMPARLDLVVDLLYELLAVVPPAGYCGSGSQIGYLHGAIEGTIGRECGDIINGAVVIVQRRCENDVINGGGTDDHIAS